MIHQKAWLKHAVLGALLVFPTIAAAQTAPDPHHPATGAAPASDAAASGDRGGSMMANMMSMMQGHVMGMMRREEGDLTRLFTAERIAGRLAYLRAELAITDVQVSAWNGFAEVVRAHAKRLSDARTHMAGATTASVSVVERLGHEEHLVSLRLDALRALKPALAALHAALGEDQKKAMEELLAPPQRMMPMGMMQGGGMSMPRSMNR